MDERQTHISLVNERVPGGKAIAYIPRGGTRLHRIGDYALDIVLWIAVFAIVAAIAWSILGAM